MVRDQLNKAYEAYNASSCLMHASFSFDLLKKVDFHRIIDFHRISPRLTDKLTANTRDFEFESQSRP